MNEALTIARYLVTFCSQKNVPISNLQLQKILYFVQRECLKTLGRPAFSDNIVAWKLGPVVIDVYSEFSSYAARPILREYPDIIHDQQIAKIVDKVAQQRMRTSAWALVAETHKEGSPWYKVYYGKGNNKIIPLNYIRMDI